MLAYAPSTSLVGELEFIAQRLAELQSTTSLRVDVDLSAALAEIWSTSIVAVQGSALFLARVHETFAGPAPAPKRVGAVTHAGKQLREAVTRLEESRLRGHVALSGCNGSIEADRREGSERATGSGHHQPEQFVLRALCPQCEELLEWAPSFYGAARSAVGMTLGELKTRCAERTEELRHELASERRRLRQYVGEEVDVLLEVGVRTESSRNAAPACTESAQQQQPRQVLDALRSKARDLQRQRKRCADQEHLQKFRKQAVDGVMMSVELHLDEVWEQSMSSWYDAALRPPLLYAPKGSLGSPMSTAVQDWKLSSSKRGMDVACGTPLSAVFAAAAFATARPSDESPNKACSPDRIPTLPPTRAGSPMGVRMDLMETPDEACTSGEWKDPFRDKASPLREGQARFRSTPQGRHCDSQQEVSSRTGPSLSGPVEFRMDILDAPAEATAAALAGRDMIRDYEFIGASPPRRR